MMFLEITNRISIPQILGVLAGVSLILEVFRRVVFKFLTEWKADQFKMHRENQIRQLELENELHELRSCIHKIPGHPENGSTQ